MISPPDGSVVRRIAIPVEGFVAELKWSPGSRRFVYEALSSGATTLALVDLRSGVASPIRGTAGAADPTWSARGEIAFAKGRSIYAVQPSGGRLRRLARGTVLSRQRGSARVLTRGTRRIGADLSPR